MQGANPTALIRSHTPTYCHWERRMTAYVVGGNGSSGSDMFGEARLATDSPNCPGGSLAIT